MLQFFNPAFSTITKIIIFLMIASTVLNGELRLNLELGVSIKNTPTGKNLSIRVLYSDGGLLRSFVSSIQAFGDTLSKAGQLERKEHVKGDHWDYWVNKTDDVRQGLNYSSQKDDGEGDKRVFTTALAVQDNQVVIEDPQGVNDRPESTMLRTIEAASPYGTPIDAYNDAFSILKITSPVNHEKGDHCQLGDKEYQEAKEPVNGTQSEFEEVVHSVLELVSRGDLVVLAQVPTDLQLYSAITPWATHFPKDVFGKTFSLLVLDGKMTTTLDKYRGQWVAGQSMVPLSFFECSDSDDEKESPESACEEAQLSLTESTTALLPVFIPVDTFGKSASLLALVSVLELVSRADMNALVPINVQTHSTITALATLFPKDIFGKTSSLLALDGKMTTALDKYRSQWVGQSMVPLSFFERSDFDNEKEFPEEVQVQVSSRESTTALLPIFIPVDSFGKSTSLLALDSVSMTTLDKNGGERITKGCMTASISLLELPSKVIDDEVALPMVTSFAANPTKFLTIASTSSSSINLIAPLRTLTFDLPPSITSPAGVFLTFGGDLADWTIREALRQSQDSTRPITNLGLWIVVFELSLHFVLAAYSRHPLSAPLKRVEHALTRSPSRLGGGGGRVPFDIPLPMVATSNVSTVKQLGDTSLHCFAQLLSGVRWSLYTSFIYLLDAVFELFGFDDLGEDRLLFLELMVGGNPYHDEGICLDRFIRNPLVLLPFNGPKADATSQPFFIFGQTHGRLALQEAIPNTFSALWAAEKAEVLAEDERLWDMHDPERFASYCTARRDDDDLPDAPISICMPCTIYLTPYEVDQSGRVRATIVFDTDVDDPEYSEAVWYDRDFRQRQIRTDWDDPDTGESVTFYSNRVAIREFDLPETCKEQTVGYTLFQIIHEFPERQNEIKLDRPLGGPLTEKHGPEWFGMEGTPVVLPNYIFRPQEHDRHLMKGVLELPPWEVEVPGEETGFIEQEIEDIEMEDDL